MSEPDGLFDGVLARGGVREAVGDQAWLRAMLDVEVALGRAQARVGLIPSAHAEAIERASHAGTFDAAALGVAAAASGNPVVPLVRALTEAVEGPGGGDVHRGATSQDVVDTAAMLVVKRAFDALMPDLMGAADAAATLAAEHRDTPMAGRSILQQALPITFGLKAAGWMSGLDGATASLDRIRWSGLAVQLGGAAGTLASLGEDGITVVRAFAEELDLAEPVMPWHTQRGRIAEIAGALGEAAGAAGKPARDVILLAQTEVAEVREGMAGRGGSSTLPHKRNPVAAVSAVAGAMQAPGLVSTLLTSMLHEHERAAGAWHAEWRPLSELLRSTGSAAAWLRDCLEHLEIDQGMMRRNLELTKGAIVAERVTTALATSVGRLAAHDLVERAIAEAARADRPLAESLPAVPEIRDHLDADRIAKLLEPGDYLGSAGAFVDRALQAHGAYRRAAAP